MNWRRIQGVLAGTQLAAKLFMIVVVLVLVAIFLWGSFALLGIGFKHSLAFVGLALLFTTILLFLIWTPSVRTLFAFQLTMGLGLFLSLQSFETSTPFASSTAFEVGSLAMLVTTTFYVKKDSGKFYRELLLISTTSSFLLLFAGILDEVIELTVNAGVSVPTTPLYASVVSSFFVLGSIDLAVLSVYMFRFALPEKAWTALSGSKEGSNKEKENRTAETENRIPSVQGLPAGVRQGPDSPVAMRTASSVFAAVLVIILVASGISLYFGLVSQSFLAPMVQGSVLAAVIGGLFKIVSDSISSRSKLEQFKLSQIYPTQVRVIENLQRMLVGLETGSKGYTSLLQWEGEEGRKKMMVKVGEDGRAIQSFLMQNRIYLRASLCDKLEKMIEDYFRVWWSWSVDSSFPEGRRSPTSDEVEAERKKIWAELPNLRKELEDEYREIFGIR